MGDHLQKGKGGSGSLLRPLPTPTVAFIYNTTILM